jgi:hypothetical protein
MNTMIGLDPGGTTGWALYYPDLGKFTVGQITGDDSHRKVGNLLQYNRPAKVIYERFDYRAKQRAADLTPVEIIGVIKLYHQNHPKTELVAQSQLKGKTGLWTDDKLKALELYVPGQPHAMDALRQVLYYLTVEQGENYWVNRYRSARSA